MSRNRLILAFAATAGLASIANAQFASIRTNAGGADADVREEQVNVVGGIALGTNLGASTEISTRVVNSVTTDTPGTSVVDAFPSADRSGLTMLKFNISSLPNHNTPGFWDPTSKVQLRLYVRNANNVNNLFGANPSDPSQEVNMRMRVRALDPSKVYGDDDANAFNRVDRVGNSYVASQNKYNWDESGVTYYNAPGITPHRVVDNAQPGAMFETLGIFDDFNSDTIDLGSFTPRDFLVPPANALAQGSAIVFDNDTLRDLVFDAQDAGRTHITLMVHIDNDGNRHQPLVGINGVTPSGMLNRNYLFVPKEHITVSASLSNANGDFSPELRVVPEPASLGLVLGGGLMLLRRKRA